MKLDCLPMVIKETLSKHFILHLGLNAQQTLMKNDKSHSLRFS